MLVTHALHVLDQTDHIIFMNNGQVVDEGTYEVNIRIWIYLLQLLMFRQELLDRNEAFAKLIAEHGAKQREEEANKEDTTAADEKLKDADKIEKGPAVHQMQEEERETGAVAWSTYTNYQRRAGGLIWMPILLFLLVATQAAQGQFIITTKHLVLIFFCVVGNNLLLGFWTAESIEGFSQAQYIGLYAGLGIAQAIFQFLVTFAFAIVCLKASLSLFMEALTHVLRSPVSFFDTTPMGMLSLSNPS